MSDHNNIATILVKGLDNSDRFQIYRDELHSILINVNIVVLVNKKARTFASSFNDNYSEGIRYELEKLGLNRTGGIEEEYLYQSATNAIKHFHQQLTPLKSSFPDYRLLRDNDVYRIISSSNVVIAEITIISKYIEWRFNYKSVDAQIMKNYVAKNLIRGRDMIDEFGRDFNMDDHA